MSNQPDKIVRNPKSFSPKVREAMNYKPSMLWKDKQNQFLTNECADSSVDQNTIVVHVNDSETAHWDIVKKRIAFDEIDADHDGRIQKSELRTFLKRVSRNSMPVGMATTIMKRADNNKDGVLSFEEFVKLCDSHEWLNISFIKYCGKITGHVTDDTKLSYEFYYNHRLFPLVIYTFSLIQIIFFLNDQLTNSNSTKTQNLPSGPKNGNFSALSMFFLYNNSRKLEIWRFLTYMFVHTDYYHIGSNLFVQILAGIPLEMIHGFKSVSILYCASVFAGSICVSAITQCKYLVGASAGVFGLLGGHFSTLILNWNEMNYKWIRILILCVFVVVNTIVCLYSTLEMDRALTISTIGHVSGFVMGLLVGILVLKNLKVLSFEQQLGRVVKFLLPCLVVVAILLSIWCPEIWKISSGKALGIK